MKLGSLRKLIILLLIVVIIGGLLWRSSGSIGLKGFSWASLGDSIRHARVSLLLLSLFAIYVAYAIRAQRWVRFCRYLGHAGFLSVYKSTLVGFAAIFLLGRAGEPIRPLLIARKERMSVSAMFGIYVLERIFDTAATAVLAGISLLVFPQQVFGGANSKALLAAARTAGIGMLVGLTAAVSFLVYFRFHGTDLLARKIAPWRGHPGWKAKVASLLSGLSEGIQAIRTFGDLVSAVGYSAMHWVLVAFIYHWVPMSFGGRLAELDFPAALLVLAFTMVGSVAQLPGIGGGSQLFCFLALTSVFGVEKEPAAAAAITLWLITFAGSSLAGVPLMLKEGFSMGELRRLASEEKKAEAAGSHIPDAPNGSPKKGDTTQ